MIWIAIRMLIGDRVKYAGLVLGVAFTAFLVTLAASFFAGFMTRGFSLISENPAADVWVMDTAVQSVEPAISLPGWALERVRAVEGVASGMPLVLASADMRLPGGAILPVDIIAVDNATLAGAPAPEGVSIDAIRGELSAFVDAGGTVDKLRAPLDGSPLAPGEWARLSGPFRTVRAGDDLMINDHTVHVAGVTRTLPRFPPRPLLYMTIGNALRVLPIERTRTTFVLVRATLGLDPRVLARWIERRTGLKARTSAEFKADTVRWTLDNSEDVGDVSAMLAIAGCIGLGGTGVLLFMFTNEQARHYAVLCAMGATRPVLALMVAAQAGFVGALGAGVGIGLCATLGRNVIGDDAPFRFMWFAPVAACAAVLLACVVAALVSLRPVLTLLPGDVFARA